MATPSGWFLCQKIRSGHFEGQEKPDSSDKLIKDRSKELLEENARD
jgi:hypothetical protein